MASPAKLPLIPGYSVHPPVRQADDLPALCLVCPAARPGPTHMRWDLAILASKAASLPFGANRRRRRSLPPDRAAALPPSHVHRTRPTTPRSRPCALPMASPCRWSWGSRTRPWRWRRCSCRSR